MLGIASGPIFLGFIILHFAWRLLYLIFAIPLFLSAVPVTRMKVDLLNEEKDKGGEGEAIKITSVMKTSFILLLGLTPPCSRRNIPYGFAESCTKTSQ